MQQQHVHTYGWKRDLPSPFDPVHEHMLLSAAPIVPEADNRPHWPAPYDQGALGSCTGNGLGGGVHYVLKKEGLVDAKWLPARNFVYWNERSAEGTVMSDAGANIRDGVRVIQNKGVPDEKLWPYSVENFTQRPSALAFKDALKHRALSAGRVAQTHTDLRMATSQGYNIVFGFSVFESFESDEVARTGIVPMPAHGEDLLGGHCAVLVGHSDSRKRYIGRNSWGLDWGIKGYFEIPYDFIENPQLASDFWVVKVVS